MKGKRNLDFVEAEIDFCLDDDVAHIKAKLAGSELGLLGKSEGFVNTDGGILLRREYGYGKEQVDLSVYDSSLGARWGRKGVPEF